MRKPAVPAPRTHVEWVKTPIDAFVLAKLEQHGLSPSPRADARTLVRRLYFDLIGLPPSPEEVAGFPSGSSERFDAAYQRLVDRLLDSPHHGERWARHWLDVARYADTTGYLPKGQKRYSYASHYRDYVVRAFNEDLPYNEFLLEQLAADQLRPRDGKPRPLEAMGFLTLGRLFLNNRHDIIDDRIDVATRGLMGLTVTCARCHDHPYDPVPTADYYSLYGVFANSWETAPEPQSEAIRAEFVQEREALQAELAKLGGHVFDAAGRATQRRIEQIKARLDELAWMDRPASERSLALADVAEPTPARIFTRGNPATPGDEAPRRFLAALSGQHRKPFAQGSGRLELAQAIASPDNPLTSRVIVNRVWMHHFGEGLVRTPGDFGARAEPPTHPELLDWLAAWFVENGWSLKKLHRLIVSSAVYQQKPGAGSREPGAEGREFSHPASPPSVDPDNRLLWRADRRRLDFEAMRDSLLCAAGRLDRTIGGAPVKLTEQPFSTRRTLYGYMDRQDPPGLLSTFDFPAPDAACTRRFQTTVPQHALFFLNSDFVLEQARHLAARVAASPASSGRDPVRAVFQAVYQRDPTDEEASGARRLVAEAAKEAFVPPPWQFGFGSYDAGRRRVEGFQRLPLFQDGSWRAGTDLPDREFRYLSHNANGGHPGRDNSQAAVRRWVSPVSGKISIEGSLAHNLPEGDGVRGLIVSSRHGELGAWEVKESETKTNVRGVEVKAGDTIDFTVEGRGNTRFDHFLWAPVIRCAESDVAAHVGREWDARRDFAAASKAWAERPLNGLELLAHALLMSNEFLFVD